MYKKREGEGSWEGEGRREREGGRGKEGEGRREREGEGRREREGGKGKEGKGWRGKREKEGERHGWEREGGRDGGMGGRAKEREGKREEKEKGRDSERPCFPFLQLPPQMEFVMLSFLPVTSLVRLIRSVTAQYSFSLTAAILFALSDMRRSFDFKLSSRPSLMGVTLIPSM